MTLILFAGPVQEPSPVRIPVPDVVQLREGEKLVREVLKDDFARKGPEERRVLARKLLQQGLETKDDTAVAYFLLKEAQVVAAEVADIPTGLAAATEADKVFDVDGMALRMAFLAEAAKTAKLAATHKEVAEACMALLSDALAKGDFALAERAGKEASAAARKAKEVALVGQADAALKSIGPAKTRMEALKSAREALIKDPKDPAANLAVGRFECFFSGRWDVGLPLLARGNDPALQDTSAKDLAKPTDGMDQLALGDAWWAIAEKEAGDLRAHIQKRAAYWYAKAKGKLTGLAKAKAAKRSEILGDLPPEDVLDPANLVGWWAFDEGKGTAASGGSKAARALTLLAGAKWAPGVAGTSLDLHGGADCATAADLPTLNAESDSWTVACFVLPRAKSTYRLVNKWHNATTRGWLFDVNTSVAIRAGTETQLGAVRIRLNDGKVNVENSAEAGLTLEKWTHVAFVIDRTAGEARLYGGGNRIGRSVPLRSIGSLTCPASLGVGFLPDTAPQFAGNALNGSIDDLRIYRRVLSDAEIQTLAGNK